MADRPAARGAAALLLGLLAAGCGTEGTAPPGGLQSRLFERYVSLGNSIAAGFQAGGINDSTQQQSFAILLARSAGASLAYPTLAGRGCPAPLTNNVSGDRVGLGRADECDGRSAPSVEFIQNLAVPGAQTADLLRPSGGGADAYDRYAALFLGGRSPVEAMRQVRPTFVTLEIGANDVLGALLNDANPGDVGRITPLADFQAAYGRVLDSIAATGAAVVLFAVPDVTVIPYVSRGSTYWCLKHGCPGIAPALPANFSVSDACAPAAKGDSILVPWTKGVSRVLQAAASPGSALGLDCAVDADVVTPAEFAAIRSASAAFNAYVRAQAQARGWAYLDLNPPFQALAARGEVPAFPDIQAVPGGGSVTFGPWFTLDGFHPSAAAHRLVADSLIALINRTYGTALR